MSDTTTGGLDFGSSYDAASEAAAASEADYGYDAQESNTAASNVAAVSAMESAAASYGSSDSGGGDIGAPASVQQAIQQSSSGTPSGKNAANNDTTQPNGSTTGLSGMGFEYNPSPVNFAGVSVIVDYPNAGLDPSIYPTDSESYAQATQNLNMAQGSYHAQAVATGQAVAPSGYAEEADIATYNMGIAEGNTPSGNNSLVNVVQNAVADLDTSVGTGLPSLASVLAQMGSGAQSVWDSVYGASQGGFGLLTNATSSSNTGSSKSTTSPSSAGGKAIGTGTTGTGSTASPAAGTGGGSGTDRLLGAASSYLPWILGGLAFIILIYLVVSGEGSKLMDDVGTKV